MKAGMQWREGESVHYLNTDGPKKRLKRLAMFQEITVTAGIGGPGES